MNICRIGQSHEAPDPHKAYVKPSSNNNQIYQNIDYDFTRISVTTKIMLDIVVKSLVLANGDGSIMESVFTSIEL